MNRRVFLAAGLATIALSACSGSWGVKYDNSPDASVSRGWRLARVSVVVPDTLTVSESNSFAPNADIVWHGEPYGDRREQVAAVLKEGLVKGASGLRGSRPVVLSARLHKFHGVTPAAVERAPAAVHNIKYDLQVFDARSGKPLTDAVLVSADLEADVGTSAIIAAIEGRSQRVRIVQHISGVTAGWLGLGPDQRRTFQGIGR